MYKKSYRSGRKGQSKNMYGNNSGGRGGYYKPRSNKSGRRGPKKAFIHPSKFVQTAKPRTEEATYVPQHSFQDFNLNPLIQKNLQDMGYKNPSPIQDKTIPHGLAKEDILGISNTGTGKTAAFAIPVLNRLIAEPKSKAIVLAPTRELAEQIEQQCRMIGKSSGLFGALLIGGTSMNRQLRDLKCNPRIIVGTPGRVKDHLQRKSLRIDDCNITVLDEVDRMLDMGFVNDITEILSYTNPDRQSLYFSATLDNRVKGIIDKFSKNAVHISVKSRDTGDNINQDVVHHDSSNKLDKLHEIISHELTTKAIIFDDTQRSVEKLSRILSEKGFAADSIHGGKTQSQRQRVLKRFKNNEVTILVATDVAARGIDVSDISHVINYSLPQSYDDYVHRIGRTGRADKTGQAFTFIEQ